MRGARVPGRGCGVGGVAATEPDPLPSPGVRPTAGRAKRAAAAVPGLRGGGKRRLGFREGRP